MHFNLQTGLGGPVEVCCSTGLCHVIYISGGRLRCCGFLAEYWQPHRSARARFCFSRMTSYDLVCVGGVDDERVLSALATPHGWLLSPKPLHRQSPGSLQSFGAAVALLYTCGTDDVSPDFQVQRSTVSVKLFRHCTEADNAPVFSIKRKKTSRKSTRVKKPSGWESWRR